MTPGATATPVPDAPAQASAEPAGLDYPTRRDEPWRYAPHDELRRLSFGPPTAAAGTAPELPATQVPTLDGVLIVVANGVVDTALSSLGSTRAGLKVSSLSDALAGGEASAATHFDPDTHAASDALGEQNRKFGRDGVFVDIAAGHEIDAPIHIVDVVTPDETRNGSCSGVVIHLAENSAATIVETRIGTSEAFGGSNTRTTITLEENASLEHVVLQDLPSTQIHLGHVDVTQRAGSELRARSFNLGAAYGRLAYTIDLAGPRAHVDLSGLYLGTGEQTLDQQVTVVHAAKDCTSRQSYRGVLDDKSTGVFMGTIDVRPGADGTDAEQANDNLLLSNRAEANTQPRLEILADDVACKHGATVGQLDDTAIYYLRTRGIGAAEARKLLIDAFADRAVDDIGIDGVRTWVRERLGTAHA